MKGSSEGFLKALLRKMDPPWFINRLGSDYMARASVLLCLVCCVEFVEVEFDFEVDGVVLPNVKALRCPACKEERFTPEQYEAIRKESATQLGETVSKN
jgi:hypothetical protein